MKHLRTSWDVIQWFSSHIYCILEHPKSLRAMRIKHCTVQDRLSRVPLMFPKFHQGSSVTFFKNILSMEFDFWKILKFWVKYTILATRVFTVQFWDLLGFISKCFLTKYDPPGIDIHQWSLIFGEFPSPAILYYSIPYARVT